MIRVLVRERDMMAEQLLSVAVVEQVYPSDANFLLVKVKDARAVYTALLSKGIVVRDRSNVQLCEGCLRITVGSPAENAALVNSLKDFVTTL
jgi:histidinol-phosphate aminotransferase